MGAETRGRRRSPLLLGGIIVVVVAVASLPAVELPTVGFTGGGEGGRAGADVEDGNGARVGMLALVTPEMAPDIMPPNPPPLIKLLTMPPMPADNDFPAVAFPVPEFEPAPAPAPAPVAGGLLGCMPKK